MDRQAPEQDGLGWLLAQLDRAALSELEWAVAVKLDPPATPTQDRARELGSLAQLLNQRPPEPGLGFPLIRRSEYDIARSPGAPSSATLVRRYRSWHATCSAAYLVDPATGHYDPRNRPWRLNQPWPHPQRAKPKVRTYTRVEVLDAIRACATSLERRPSLPRYLRWARHQRRQARGLGEACRYPTLSVLYRFFPPDEGGFPAAREAALGKGSRRS
jgi:hypothetical protein